ncbi:hypothetical protein WA588_002991 [Blastocystis sp. NMH]
MNRFGVCSYRFVSSTSFASFRAMGAFAGRTTWVSSRHMATEASADAGESAPRERIEISEDVKNFALPIEKLGSPVERYQRVVMLYRKPNQISKNMLNRYFKLCKTEEDLPYVQKLLNFLDTNRISVHPVAANSLVTSLMSFLPVENVYSLISKHKMSLGACPASAYTILMNSFAESNKSEKIRAVVHETYSRWPQDQSYINHAVELLLGSKRLGTAYSLVMGLPSYEAKPSTEMLSKMLDAAVEAKDRLRAEGIAQLLKAQGVEKKYEIVGEREKAYVKEQQARREKKKEEGKEEKKEEVKEKKEEVKEKKEEKKHEKHERKEKHDEKHEKKEKEEKHEKHEKKEKEEKHEKHEKKEKEEKEEKHEKEGKHEEKHEKEGKHEKAHEKHEKAHKE